MDIEVILRQKTDKGWDLHVVVDKSEFEVWVDKKYWQDLTQGGEGVESLVKRSFEFLLERESEGSILKSFNLKVIEKYFPEYPDKIRLQ